MKTRTVAIGVFAVLLVAVFFGAPGLFGGDDPGQNATPTPEGEPIAQAPGVGDETLENVTNLLEFYRGSMTNVGFVAEAESTSGTTVYTYARDGSRLVEQENGSLVTWTNGTVAFTREVTDGNATYRRPENISVSAERLTRYNRFEALLTAARYERDGTSQCGDTTCVVLTANGSSGGPYENFTATVHVDETGVIYRFDADYLRTIDDRSFDLTFSVTRLGKQSIERPDWVGEATNSTE